MPLNPDQINNADPKLAAQSCFALVDVMQNMPTHVQVLAPAILFLAVCQRFKANPEQVLKVAANIQVDPLAGQRVEFLALQEYCRQELK